MNTRSQTFYMTGTNPHELAELALDSAHEESMGFCCVERIDRFLGKAEMVTVSDALDTLCETYKSRDRIDLESSLRAGRILTTDRYQFMVAVEAVA